MTNRKYLLKRAYSQPAGDLAGVQTFVNENNKDNLPANTSKPSKDNWKSRPSAPEHKEQAQPIPPDHRPTRDNEKTNKTPGQPSYNTPPQSSKQPEGKPLHQRMRTLDKPGEEYGTPYIEQGTLLNQRRTMTSGYDDSKPLVPSRPQRQQIGKAKVYYKTYYRRNRGRVLSRAKRKYRQLRTRSRFKRWRQKMKQLPIRFKRKPGGSSDPKKRSQKWRDKQQEMRKADFLREEVRPSDLDQTWRRKNDKGTPDGPNQRAEIPDGTTSWVDVGPNQRNPSAPSHQPQDYVVDNNPGSAKVIPEGHGFANRMASRVASRYLTANLERRYKEYTLKALPLKAGIQWTILAFDDKGEQVGFLYYFPEKYKGEIANIGVNPEHQRKGLATALYKYAVDLAGTKDMISGETRPVPTHSKRISDEGKAWKKSLRRRVASRYLTAAKIAEIEGKTLPDLISKGRSLQPRLVRVDAPNRIWWFDVKGSEPTPYRVKVKVLVPSAAIRKIDKADVQLSCTCQFWRWQGPEHWAKQNDYLYGKPVGTASKPSEKDPNGRHWMCKHVAAVLVLVKTYDVPQARGKAAALRYLSSSLRLAGL